jgi:hypothetical protein
MRLHTLAPIGLLLLAATAYADTAVYDLDTKNAKEIANALQATLNARCGLTNQGASGVSPNCRVELLPTGQILVEAPAASQAQIGAVLKAIAARNASPAPRVTLQYWVIYGEPGKPDAADASLKPLSTVLQQLERTHGELGFSVQDTATITGQAGTSARAGGGSLEINENLRASGDSLDLMTQISFARKPVVHSLNVNVTIKRGEFLVLGERTTPGEPGKDQPEKPGMLFYVVHWPQGQ